MSVPACESSAPTATADVATTEQPATEQPATEQPATEQPERAQAPEPIHELAASPATRDATTPSTALEARRHLRAHGQPRRVLAERGLEGDRRRAVRELRSREQRFSGDKRAALEVLRQNSHQLHRCYLAASGDDDAAPASLRLRLDIDPTGHATAVEVVEGDLPGTDLTPCLTERIQALTFPATDAGVRLLHPLRFGPRHR